MHIDSEHIKSASVYTENMRFTIQILIVFIGTLFVCYIRVAILCVVIHYV